MTTLFTIGYERAGQAAFIEALQAAGIELLVDVRELPSSRRAGFSKTPLARALSAVGIGYHHVRALGTPKEGRVANKQKQWARFWSIVDARLATPEAEAALDAVAGLARRSRVALLCLEADPAICHRSRVAERVAARDGFTIEHLHVEPDFEL